MSSFTVDDIRSGQIVLFKLSGWPWEDLGEESVRVAIQRTKGGEMMVINSNNFNTIDFGKVLAVYEATSNSSMRDAMRGGLNREDLKRTGDFKLVHDFEDSPRELTLEEIAGKFDIDVKNLRIKE